MLSIPKWPFFTSTSDANGSIALDLLTFQFLSGLSLLQPIRVKSRPRGFSSPSFNPYVAFRYFNQGEEKDRSNLHQLSSFNSKWPFVTSTRFGTNSDTTTHLGFNS